MSKDIMKSDNVKKNINSKKFFKTNKNNLLKPTLSYKIFTYCNNTFLVLLAILCLFPLIQVLAVSFSHDLAIKAGKVFFIPVDFALNENKEAVYYPMRFNLAAYAYMLSNKEFWLAFVVAIERVVFGTLINMFLIVICAYPLSQDPKKFPMRLVYVWFFFFTSLFSGGLIPGYYVVYTTGLLDSIWGLIIPGAVSVWSVILLLNFFRQLPKELDEAAFMDGAGHWTILFKIYLPLSLPALATLTLFSIVGHWNEWFTAIIYINNRTKWPLATYLQSIIIGREITAPPDSKAGTGSLGMSQQNMIAAQIFIGAVPILMVYPFLQKYFAKGIVLGSVKG